MDEDVCFVWVFGLFGGSDCSVPQLIGERVGEEGLGLEGRKEGDCVPCIVCRTVDVFDCIFVWWELGEEVVDVSVCHALREAVGGVNENFWGRGRRGLGEDVVGDEICRRGIGLVSRRG